MTAVPKRWARRKEARPAELVAAALQLFSDRGFAATRLDDVATVAGVSKGTVYLYFESKEQLFEAIFEEECYAQAEQVLTLDCADRDIAAALTRFGCIRRERARRRR